MCIQSLSGEGTVSAVKGTISTLMDGVIPLCVVIPTNLGIIGKLTLDNKLRHNLGASTSNVDEATKITVMLLSITVTYIVLIVPMTVVVLMVDGGGRKLSDYALLIAFSNLPYLNMSLNFYLYLLSGQMFRNEVKHFLTRYCKCYSNEKESPEESAGDSGISTANTESNYI